MENSNLKNQAIKFQHGSLKLTELTQIVNQFPFEIRFINPNGKLTFITNSLTQNYGKLNQRVSPTLEFTNLPSMFDILENLKHGKKSKIERAIKVDDRYFNLQFIAINDNNNNYLGCLQITTEVTEIINKFKFGGFIESANDQLASKKHSQFHYSNPQLEEYRSKIEKEINDLNTDDDAISGASEL